MDVQTIELFFISFYSLSNLIPLYVFVKQIENKNRIHMIKMFLISKFPKCSKFSDGILASE